MRDGKKKRLAGGKGGHKFWGGKDIERVGGAEEAPNGPLEVPFSRRALLAGAFTTPPAMKKSMEDWGIEMPSALAVRQTRARYGSPKYDPNGFFRTPGWVFDAGDEAWSVRQECYHLIGSPGPPLGLHRPDAQEVLRPRLAPRTVELQAPLGAS